MTFTANQPVVYADNDTFPTQCLDGECNQGDIILTAPAGTVFDAVRSGLLDHRRDHGDGGSV